MSLVLGASNVNSSITHHLLVSNLRANRHARGQLHCLARQAIGPVARPLGKDVTAATTNAAAARTGTGIAGALLAIHLLGRAGHFAATLGLTVPCRRFAWYITTTSCSNCLLMRGASRSGSIS